MDRASCIELSRPQEIGLTEDYILKQLIRQDLVQQIPLQASQTPSEKEPGDATPSVATFNSNKTKQQAFRHYWKLWQACNKYIFRQAQKHRFVDVGLLGCFTLDKEQKVFVYHPSKDLFRIVKRFQTNTCNQRPVDENQSVYKINWQAVAQQQGTKKESISQFLAVFVHYWLKECEKSQITLIFKFGQLSFGPNQALEFFPVPLDQDYLRKTRETVPQTMEQQLKSLVQGQTAFGKASPNKTFISSNSIMGKIANRNYTDDIHPNDSVSVMSTRSKPRAFASNERGGGRLKSLASKNQTKSRTRTQNDRQQFVINQSQNFDTHRAGENELMQTKLISPVNATFQTFDPRDQSPQGQKSQPKHQVLHDFIMQGAKSIKDENRKKNLQGFLYNTVSQKQKQHTYRVQGKRNRLQQKHNALTANQTVFNSNNNQNLFNTTAQESQEKFKKVAVNSTIDEIAQKFIKSDKKTKQELLKEFRKNQVTFEKKLSLSGRNHQESQLQQQRKRNEGSLDNNKSPYLEQKGPMQEKQLITQDQRESMYNKRRSSQQSNTQMLELEKPDSQRDNVSVERLSGQKLVKPGSKNLLTRYGYQGQFKRIGIDRNAMGADYQFQVPAFLKSQGPFNVYNHHEKKGKSELAINNEALAKKSYQKELANLKLQKQIEKFQFQQALQVAAQQQQAEANMTRMNNLENQEYIRVQMLNNKMRKQEDHQNEKKFTRPNFGPDESEEYQDWARQHNSATKSNMKNELSNQMRDRNQLSKLQEDTEKQVEKLSKFSFFNSLDALALQQVFEEEEKMRKQKEIKMKQDLKQAWLEQMKTKQERESAEKIFL